MFARVSRGEVAPGELDQFVQGVRTALDELSHLDGYLGISVLADRQSGAVAVGTMWASAEAMQASESIGERARGAVRAASPSMRVTDVHRYQRVLVERAAAEPRPYTFNRLTFSTASLDKLDELIAFMREQMPSLRSLPGFRVAFLFVDRETGAVMAESIWDSAEEREASEAVIGAMRAQAGQVSGGAAREVALFENVLLDLKLTAPA
jgi:heme-degrading monooxygenase HmoA